MNKKLFYIVAITLLVQNVYSSVAANAAKNNYAHRTFYGRAFQALKRNPKLATLSALTLAGLTVGGIKLWKYLNKKPAEMPRNELVLPAGGQHLPAEMPRNQASQNRSPWQPTLNTIKRRNSLETNISQTPSETYTTNMDKYNDFIKEPLVKLKTINRERYYVIPKNLFQNMFGFKDIGNIIKDEFKAKDKLLINTKNEAIKLSEDKATLDINKFNEEIAKNIGILEQENLKLIRATIISPTKTGKINIPLYAQDKELDAKEIVENFKNQQKSLKKINDIIMSKILSSSDTNKKSGLYNIVNKNRTPAIFTIDPSFKINQENNQPSN